MIAKYQFDTTRAMASEKILFFQSPLSGQSASSSLYVTYQDLKNYHQKTALILKYNQIIWDSHNYVKEKKKQRSRVKIQSLQVIYLHKVLIL